MMAGVKGKSGGKREGAGRSTFKPTASQIELVHQLAAFGLRYADICLFVKDKFGNPISEPTLRKNFSDEVGTGKLKANVKVAQTLYKKAIAGDTTCMIFWLKTQAGWKDSQRVELTGPAGGPVQSVRMTADEFKDVAKTVLNEV
jgi:hypothetical protein